MTARTQSSAPNVIVVGAGPVGLAAALAAHGAGAKVRIIEAEPEDRLRPGSRAIFLHKDPIALLDSFAPGVADEIYANSMLWTRNLYTFRGRIIFNREFRKSTSASREYGASQSQKITERILLNALAQRGIEIHWNRPVVGIRSSAAGVSIAIENGDSIDADYVIAADGARSAIRKSLGIEMVGKSGDGAYNVIVDVEELPDQPTPLYCYFHYEMPELEYRNLLQVPMQNSWRLGLTLKPEDDADYMSSEEGVKTWLSKVMDARYAERIQWISTYRYHQLVAESFTDEHRRVLLAGEAAHLFAPWGGRGLNSGIVDACDAAVAIVEASRAESEERAREIIDECAKDRREAAEYNKKAVEYALNLLSPPTAWARFKRRILASRAPKNRKASIRLATGPNAGFSVGRAGKGIY